MSRLTWTANWKFETPLHLGTGNSLPGYADRIVRRNAAGYPELTGEAVKGAVRLAAERLCRWYIPHMLPEADNSSGPLHPALRRIFAPGENDPFYRFAHAQSIGKASFRATSTALDNNGAAKDDHLRTVENFSTGLSFHVRISATGPSFADDRSSHWLDAMTFTLALALCDSIGGKRSSGLGRISCQSIELFPENCPGRAPMKIDASTAAGLVPMVIAAIQENSLPVSEVCP